MRCICRNSAGSQAEQGHKVKFKVVTPVNFLTPPSFSVTPRAVSPANSALVLPATTASAMGAAFMQALHDRHSQAAVSTATYKATPSPEPLPSSSSQPKKLLDQNSLLLQHLFPSPFISYENCSIRTSSAQA